MTKRRLRQDELDLWNQVARSATRLPGSKQRAVLSPEGPARPAPRVADPLPTFEIGQSHPSRNQTHVPQPKTTSERLATAPVQMDAKAFTRLKRGKLSPEARIDLHGMTLDQAHPELVRFVMTSAARGLRLVLVITGKGQHEDPYSAMPLRRGVLKQQVPQWLRMAPLGPLVLQVSEAHVKHGGGGAYYVYLRRRR